jgi:predicted aldo/keto reductase-like oxidoreductase
MLYRRFPKIEDLEVSALGLGCMRLPTKGNDPAAIDEEGVEAIFRAAIDAGVNYIDTAWPYHGERSEDVVGRTMARLGIRDKVYLATKSPVWLVKEAGDWDRYLDRQLEKLGTNHIDFYLLHALDAGRWTEVRRLGGLDFLARAKADGRIRHAGFSFHDSLKAFKEIVDGWPGWEFCQVQYNYMDEAYQAGGEGIAYAASRQLGVIVMEPLRGGSLARVPAPVKTIFGSWKKPRMPAEWALRYVLDRQEVATVLSGMGKVEELVANAAVASSAKANSLLGAERELIEEARKFFATRQKVPCTTCGYCKPCPSGVNIPEVFGLYNGGMMYDDLAGRGSWYRSALVRGGSGADQCTKCGECLEKCPQHIEIPDRLEEAHAALAGASA